MVWCALLRVPWHGWWAQAKMHGRAYRVLERNQFPMRLVVPNTTSVLLGLDDAGLVARSWHGTIDYDVALQADRPIPNPRVLSCCYFEVCVLYASPAGCVSIGLAMAIYRVYRQIGWLSRSAAWHSDDGHFFLE